MRAGGGPGVNTILLEHKTILPVYGSKSILLAIGNESRGDDGLGQAFAGRISGRLPQHWTVEHRYQLMVEDAEFLTRFDHVVFVDASAQALPGGFVLERCAPDPGASLYTHQQTPGAILHLCQSLYEHRPDAWCLGIQGYAWELGTEVSPAARENLERAVTAFALWVAA